MKLTRKGMEALMIDVSNLKRRGLDEGEIISALPRYRKCDIKMALSLVGDGIVNKQINRGWLV
jgi:5,10-methylenetetrahydrofolate reductase